MMCESHLSVHTAPSLIQSEFVLLWLDVCNAGERVESKSLPGPEWGSDESFRV